MGIQDRWKRLTKLRFAVFYPALACAIFFSSTDDRSMRIGIWFILAGLALRIWANGYAIKLEQLTTSGPYAFVRHPLYLGTILIVVGFIIMLKIYYIGSLFFLAIIIIYYRTIKKEEEMLEQKFKNLYIDYKQKVAAMLPIHLPYREGEKWRFSIKRLIKSQEYKLSIWVAIIVILFYLKEEFLIEGSRMDVKKLALITAAILLASIDLATELIKKKRVNTIK